MPGILEIIAQRHKNRASRIAKEYQMGQAYEGLTEAKQFDDEQKNAILQIADTDGFQVIMQYEAKIISKCEDILAITGLDEELRHSTQIEYSMAKAKHSFLKNLGDPNKK